MIKALVFDLDDTLFPERQFVRSGFRAVAEYLATRHEIRGFFQVAWRLFEQGIRGDIFDRALSQLHASYDDEMIQKLVRTYRKHPPCISLHDDGKWAIEYFKSRKRLGVITDGYLAVQKRKVEALDLNDAFDLIVYSDAYGADSWKPSPRTYRVIMERLGCDGSECAYVADNPLKDFVAPNLLGWMTIQIEREGGEYGGVAVETTHEAEHRITSLRQLATLIPHSE